MVVARLCPWRPRAAPGGYQPELDGLRAVAVIAVWVHHATLVAPALYPHTMPHGIYLSAGVQLFFALSGFLIYSPFVQAHLTGGPSPSLATYARRRITRIYPAYLVAFLALWALGWIVVDGGWDLFADLTLTQLYWPHGGEHGIVPAWTLCVEVSFYAFVPLWAMLVRRAARRRDRLCTELVACGTLMVVGSIALWFHQMHTLPSPLSVLLPRLPALGGGMLLAVVATGRADRPQLERWARRFPPPAVCWPVGIVAIMWTPGLPATLSDGATSWTVLAFAQVAGGLLLAAPIMLGAGSRGAVSRGLRSRLLVATGIVSYGVYLWHYDILDDLEVAPLDQGMWQAVAALAVLLAVSVGAGALSYRVVERPALAWARRRGSARP